MSAPFGWPKLERLEESIAWRRDLENVALAHVWHLETIGELAEELRRLMTQAETDERLIAVLWSRVPGDERDDVIGELQAPGSRHPNAASRLVEIVNAPG